MSPVGIVGLWSQYSFVLHSLRLRQVEMLGQLFHHSDDITLDVENTSDFGLL